jgi:hypothetical protein
MFDRRALLLLLLFRSVYLRDKLTVKWPVTKIAQVQEGSINKPNKSKYKTKKEKKRKEKKRK